MMNANNNNGIVLVKGSLQQTLAVSTSQQKTGALPPGIYDVWCDVNCWILISTFRMGGNASATPTVSSNTGYYIPANKMISVKIEEGDVINVIAASSGTFRYIKTGMVSGDVRSEFNYVAPPSNQGYVLLQVLNPDGSHSYLSVLNPDNTRGNLQVKAS